MELHPKYQVVLVCVLLLPALCLSQFTNSTATLGGGSPTGACGFDDYGFTQNSGKLTGVSEALFRGGAGCGACYQVICTDPQLCSANGATVLTTDSGGADFILSDNAFDGLAVNSSAAEQLRRNGTVNVQYRRVPCAFDGSTVKIRINSQSRVSDPQFLAIAVVYIPGTNDVVSLELSNDNGASWITASRAFGGVFAISSNVPRGPFKVRVRFSSGSQNLVESPNIVIPANWNVGDIYDTGIIVPFPTTPFLTYLYHMTS